MLYIYDNVRAENTVRANGNMALDLHPVKIYHDPT